MFVLANHSQPSPTFAIKTRRPLFMPVFNSLTQKVIVFVKAGKKWLTLTKVLAYYTMDFITTTKRFLIQTPEKINISTSLMNYLSSHGQILDEVENTC